MESSALSMMEVTVIDLREIRSVTEFQRNIKSYVGRLKKKRTPLVLTVNGRAALVVQDARSYQEVLDRLDRAETIAAIRRGMEQIGRGEGIPLDQAEAQLRKKHGFSR
jgi:PHD/YefM family antitoxin component YafN of YafNO toxin-antitoxin module